MYYQWHDNDLVLDCRIQTRARNDGFAGTVGERLKIRITAPPVDGKANAYLLEFLARAFSVPKRQLRILRGESSRDKRIRINEPATLPSLPGLEKPQRDA